MNIDINSTPAPELLEMLGVPSWPIWTKEISEFSWTYDEPETCLFLEGDVYRYPRRRDSGEHQKRRPRYLSVGNVVHLESQCTGQKTLQIRIGITLMFIDLLRRRRSIRKYTDRKLDDKTIAFIREALLRSPTSRGLNPWEFIFVTDTGLLEQLSRSKMSGTGFIANAPLAVVILGDETKSDVWVEDCSIAAINLQLLATDLGLGSCWGQIRNRPHNKTTTAETYVRRLLAIPSHLRVGMIIAVGYPDETEDAVPETELDRNKISFNRYQSDGTTSWNIQP